MEKHLKITGASEISWKDAINKTILEVSKTIDYITDITILEQSGKIDGTKIIKYFVTLDLAFEIDTNR